MFPLYIETNLYVFCPKSLVFMFSLDLFLSFEHARFDEELRQQGSVYKQMIAWLACGLTSATSYSHVLFCNLEFLMIFIFAALCDGF